MPRVRRKIIMDVGGEPGFTGSAGWHEVAVDIGPHKGARHRSAELWPHFQMGIALGTINRLTHLVDHAVDTAK